jgi:hypothetical protein
MRVAAVVCVLLAGSSFARAQPAGAQAEVLFREGRDLMKAGKYAEACTALEQSQKLEPAPTTLLNLAGCREKTNQIATAWGLFLEAERATRGGDKQLNDVAKGKAEKLEKRISKLTISVASPSDGVEVKRGTERVEAGMWGRALPIDGGTYTITASAPHKKPWSTQVVIAIEKDAKTVEVPTLEDATVATKPNPTPKPTPPVTTATAKPIAIEKHDAAPATSRSKLPYIVGAGGLVLIGGAVGIGLHARSIYDDAEAEKTNQGRRDDLESDANQNLYIAQGAGVAGVALVGVAVWLFVRSSGEQPSTTTAHVTATTNGFAVGGTF